MAISSKPTWDMDSRDSYPMLEHDVGCDVVVVGGGICGILTAYFLLKEGKNVVLAEKDSIGSGATLYTTAFITKDIDTDLVDLEANFGPDARKVWESGQAAIEKFEEIINREQIECEFERASYDTLAFSVEDRKILYEMKEILDRWKIENTIIENPDLGFVARAVLRLPHEAKFHPIKFLRAMTVKIEELGCKIFENTEIKDITSKDGIVIARADGGKIKATHSVMATYKPIEHPLAIKFKKGSYSTYMMEARTQKNLIKDGMYVDMNNPYYYFRVDPKADHDRIILGGEDHRREIKVDREKRWRGLEDYLAKLIGRDNFTIERLWGGPILEPSDGLPLIGEYEKNKYVGTAFSGNGMTYAMISGMLISDLILKRANDLAMLYDPKRIPSMKRLMIKGRDYSEEFYRGTIKKIFKRKDK